MTLVPTAPPRKGNNTLALAVVSLGVGIPLSAIASSNAGLAGLIVTWIGIVGVNAVVAWGKKSNPNS